MFKFIKAKWLILFLNKQNPSKSYPIVEQLATIGHPCAILPILDLFRGLSGFKRVGVYDEDKIISLFSSFGRAAIDPLIEMLEDSHFVSQGLAIKALAIIGDRKAITPLIRLQIARYLSLTSESKIALENISSNWSSTEEAKQALPFLLDTFRNNRSYSRIQAFRTLSIIDPEWIDTIGKEEVVLCLRDSICDYNRDHLHEVAKLLNRIHPSWHRDKESKEDVHTLVTSLVKYDVLKSESESCARAVTVLDRIQPKWREQYVTQEDILELFHILCDPKYPRRGPDRAIHALTCIGTKQVVDSMVMTLMSSLEALRLVGESSEASYRLQLMIKALGDIGNPKAAYALRETLRCEFDSLHNGSAQALEKLR